MEKENSWEKITKTGEIICKRWEDLAKKHSLPLFTSGIPALACFTIKSNNWLKYKTFITQKC